MSEVDTKLMFININDKVQPAVLAGLLNRNVSLMYQWAAIGRLPDFKNITYSYKDCIDHLVTNLLHKEEAKKYKLEQQLKAKGATSSTEVDNFDMHPLMVAKITQNIRTEKAREAELWQKIAIKQGEYVSFGDKLELVHDFVSSIKDTLLYIGNNFPETQEKIDEAMNELYQLGLGLVEEADMDAKNYIETMLNTDINKEISTDGN